MNGMCCFCSYSCLATNDFPSHAVNLCVDLKSPVVNPVAIATALPEENLTY